MLVPPEEYGEDTVEGDPSSDAFMGGNLTLPRSGRSKRIMVGELANLVRDKR